MLWYKKIWIITFITLLIGLQLFGGTTGKITGNVVDAESGLPLPGANVLIEGTVLGGAADLEGYFAILNVTPGSYTVRVSMIGYEDVVVQDVIVKIDLTTTQRITMRTAAIGLEEVVVVAKRPVIARDVSASESNIEAKKMESMPITSVTDVIGLQAGVQGLSIRGGDSRQTAFIVDGFIQADERSNIPITIVSLTTIQEVKIQTGGFNAEYGNIRSGVINIVTREGDKNHYTGAISLNIRPPKQKYFGNSVYATDSYFMRSYLDPEVCYSGTNSGAWDQHTQEQYPNFAGWDFVSQSTLLDSDPSNDLTPEGAMRLFKWQHRRQGDIKRPDYVVDAGFGGPVPYVGDLLGGLRFYASYRETQEMFIIPLTRDNYKENVGRVKLTSDLTRDMKLTLTGQYGEERSSSPYAWTTTPTGSVLRSDYEIADAARAELLYMPGWYSPAAVYRTMLGAQFNHILSSKTYYEINIQHSINRYDTREMALRDTSKVIEVLPGYYVDEAPYGFWGYSVGSVGDNIILGGWMNLGRDKSIISTTQMRFDYVSQLNRRNQFKSGLQMVFNDYDINSSTVNPGMTTWNRDQIYRVKPYRIGGYVQDKLEFQGFVANLGLRLDYTNANTVFYSLNEYDNMYKVGNGALIEEEAPTEDAKPRWAVSPRLGISHPITEDSKLYFNYGHFYTEPSSTYRFRIQREYNGSVTSIGNPNLNQEKTVAYEVGYSHNLFNQYLINIAGYYKDITDQIGWITYQNINSSVNYSKSDNNNYEDIRGFEITLDKRAGNWFTGFVNYSYMVSTSGYFGLQRYYEDPNLQREYMMQNPALDRPHPRPYFRANFDLHSPADFGPAIGGLYPIGGWNLNILGTWQAGSFTTYNPDYILGPGVINNVQWKDTYAIDLRLIKTIRVAGTQIQLYADVSNLLNTKFLSYAGFADSRDWDNYVKSLNFDWEKGVEHGNDRIGEYRGWDVAYDPLESNPNNDPEIAARNDERKENKSYIDMPNFQTFTFLNPREIKFGVKISF